MADLPFIICWNGWGHRFAKPHLSALYLQDAQGQLALLHPEDLVVEATQDNDILYACHSSLSHMTNFSRPRSRSNRRAAAAPPAAQHVGRPPLRTPEPSRSLRRVEQAAPVHVASPSPAAALQVWTDSVFWFEAPAELERDAGVCEARTLLCAIFTDASPMSELMKAAEWLLHEVAGSQQVQFEDDRSRFPQFGLALRKSLPQHMFWSFAQVAQVKAVGIASNKKHRHVAAKLAVACAAACSKDLSQCPPQPSTFLELCMSVKKREAQGQSHVPQAALLAAGGAGGQGSVGRSSGSSGGRLWSNTCWQCSDGCIRCSRATTPCKTAEGRPQPALVPGLTTKKPSTVAAGPTQSGVSALHRDGKKCKASKPQKRSSPVPAPELEATEAFESMFHCWLQARYVVLHGPHRVGLSGS